MTDLDTLRLHSPGPIELPRWFARMRGLSWLEVDGELEAIPAWVAELDTLEHLSLRSAGAFEPALAELPRLHELELSLGVLGEVPLRLIERDQLVRVRVRARELACVPLGLLVAPRLQTLILELEAAPTRPAFPRAVPGLSELDELAIQGWPLDEIPAAVLQLPALTSLTLRRCALRSLPEDWGAGQGLERLDVSGNQLTHLPASLATVTGLRSLVAADNPIEELDPALAQLRELVRLDLDDTKLESIPPQIRALPALQVLSLS